MRLNVGCGDDYREGFVNIDGSDALSRVDMVLDMPREMLSSHFAEGTIAYILCNDFLEHHFHFEAVAILRDFKKILRPGAVLEIRVPDAGYILINPFFSIERKLTFLFGGQDVPQGNADMDKSREVYPQYFCHKYGWTKRRMRRELEQLGMTISTIRRIGTNFIVKASK
jgi:hypothetical protein